MSTADTTPEDTSEVVKAPQEPPEAPEAPATPEDVASGGSDDVAAVRREAAAHRRKLREAEAERDRLAGHVQGLQRAEAERVAATPGAGFRALSDGSDLWRAEGVELAAMIDDDGRVNPAKVRQVVAKVSKAHPGWAADTWGTADAGRGESPKPAGPDFGSAIKAA